MSTAHTAFQDAEAKLRLDARPQLIVTADDFGLRQDWDRAIIGAWRRGVVGSVSVVVNGPTYSKTVGELRRLGIDHGVHLNLLSGQPSCSPADVPSLVGSDGCLDGNILRFLIRFALGRVSLADVAREWERQLERALDDGLTPSHLNSHFHLHVLPGVASVFASLAESFGIRSVRMPHESPRFGSPWAALKCAALARLSTRAEAELTGRKLRGVPSRGIARAGRLDLSAWQALLQNLGPGLTEIVCHPGQSRVETEAVCSAELRRMIDRAAILASFQGPDPKGSQR